MLTGKLIGRIRNLMSRSSKGLAMTSIVTLELELENKHSYAGLTRPLNCIDQLEVRGFRAVSLEFDGDLPEGGATFRVCDLLFLLERLDETIPVILSIHESFELVHEDGMTHAYGMAHTSAGTRRFKVLEQEIEINLNDDIETALVLCAAVRRGK